MFKSASIATLLRNARNATHQHPTAAQKSSGNYAKGRIKIHGLNIAIENPIDSYRSGVDKDGKAWKSQLKCDYGYFTGTNAIDGDAIDVFIGPDLNSELVVAIDQQNGDKFDETKFVICVKTQEQGEKLYLSNYHKGWKLGPTSTTTVSQLREWLKDGSHKKPFKGQMIKAASVTDTLYQLFGTRHLEKSAIVKKVGKKWVLFTKDMSRRLGTHDTAQEAYAQEYAIEKSQEREKSAYAPPIPGFLGSKEYNQAHYAPKPQPPARPAPVLVHPRISPPLAAAAPAIAPQPEATPQQPEVGKTKVYRNPNGTVTTRALRNPGETEEQAIERQFNEFYPGFNKREKGVQYDPAAGYTRDGVTTKMRPGLTEQKIKEMSDADIKQLYREDYNKLHKVEDPAIRNSLMEVSENAGMNLPARAAQQAAGIRQDGIPGSATAEALNQVSNPQKINQAIMGAWKAKHNELIGSGKSKYTRNVGWAQRRKDFAQSLPLGSRPTNY